MVKRTPLEEWIRKKIAPKSEELNREQLEAYQLNALQENLAYAKSHCLFYSERLSHVQPQEVQTLDDIQKIPFTTAEDIRKHNTKMVCVAQSAINRIVTLDTSGTTNLPKRIYFTEEDQELTTDFFHIGMSTFTSPGEKVLVLLPGIRPGSIGDLLQIALKRMDVETIVYGVVNDGEKVEQIILDEKVNGIVGIPQQVFALSQLANSQKIKEQGQLKHILLSTDYISNTVVKKIKENWGCEVYDHYGMTEMGLGGGVFCQALRGYHLREADMIFEIVDVDNGLPVQDGEWGEVVFTTLTRKAMPLIRYKTGDVSRFIKEPCSCGTMLKTMDKVQHRIASAARLSNGYTLTMSVLEDILFDVDGITDFDADLTLKEGVECLNVNVNVAGKLEEDLIVNAINGHPIGQYVSKGDLLLRIKGQSYKELDIKAIKKRKIIDKRRVENKDA